MTHPPIQIVDENDNPIGQSDMFEAHEKGLIHRIVRVMVENDNGQILLQKRSEHMHRWPNSWDCSAAGHVDVGEDYMVAAKRELKEELGIKNVELKELGSYYTEDKSEPGVTLKRFNRAYKVIYNQTPDKVDPYEVSEIKWVNIDEVYKLKKQKPGEVTDGIVEVLDRYYK
jgi:isopentenyl-diphosphate delta-isomerase type 1